MSIFDRDEIGDKTAGGRGAWLTPGIYAIEITRCSEGEGFKGPFAAVEGRVLEVLQEGPEDSKAATLKPGTVVSWVCMLRNPSAWGDLKKFLAAAMGIDVSRVTNANARPNFEGDGTKLAGTTLVAQVHEKPTRTGGVFTIVNWFRPE